MICEEIITKNGGEVNSIIAGSAGSGDAQEVTSETISRLSTTGAGMANSIGLVFATKTTIATSKALNLGVKIEEYDPATSTWGAAEVLLASTAIVNGVCTAALNTYQLNYSLKGRQQDVRYKWTPNLTATDTDTADVHFIAVLGDFQTIPTDPNNE